MAALVDARPLTAGIALDRRLGAAWRWTLRVTAVGCLFGAEVIHTSAVDAHRQWVAAGAFFLAISVVEGLLGVGLLVLPSRRLYLVAVGVSVATVAIWVVSRTAGLPLGPATGRPEVVGRADSICTFLEVLTVAVLVPLVIPTARGAAARGKRDRMAATAIVMVVAALTTVAARSPEPVGPRGHQANAAAHASAGRSVGDLA
jgi:hypothetical protein